MASFFYRFLFVLFIGRVSSFGYHGNFSESGRRVEVHCDSDLIAALQDNSITRIVLMRDMKLGKEWDRPENMFPVHIRRNVTIKSSLDASAFASLDFQYLTGKLQLAPNTWLTIYRLRLRGLTTSPAPSFPFLALSHGASVLFHNCLLHRTVCLPMELVHTSILATSGGATAAAIATAAGPVTTVASAVDTAVASGGRGQCSGAGDGGSGVYDGGGGGSGEAVGGSGPVTVTELLRHYCFRTVAGGRECRPLALHLHTYAYEAAAHQGGGAGTGGFTLRAVNTTLVCDHPVSEDCVREKGPEFCVARELSARRRREPGQPGCCGLAAAGTLAALAVGVWWLWCHPRQQGRVSPPPPASLPRLASAGQRQQQQLAELAAAAVTAAAAAVAAEADVVAAVTGRRPLVRASSSQSAAVAAAVAAAAWSGTGVPSALPGSPISWREAGFSRTSGSATLSRASTRALEATVRTASASGDGLDFGDGPAVPAAEGVCPGDFLSGPEAASLFAHSGPAVLGSRLAKVLDLMAAGANDRLPPDQQQQHPQQRGGFVAEELLGGGPAAEGPEAGNPGACGPALRPPELVAAAAGLAGSQRDVLWRTLQEGGDGGDAGSPFPGARSQGLQQLQAAHAQGWQQGFQQAVQQVKQQSHQNQMHRQSLQHQLAAQMEAGAGAGSGPRPVRGSAGGADGYGCSGGGRGDVEALGRQFRWCEVVSPGGDPAYGSGATDSRTKSAAETKERIEHLRRTISGVGSSAPSHEVYDNLEVTELLGSGTFGKVYKGFWNGMVVAVKLMVFPGAIIGSSQLEAMAAMEAAISTSLSHPNILQTYTWRVTPLLDASSPCPPPSPAAPGGRLADPDQNPFVLTPSPPSQSPRRPSRPSAWELEPEAGGKGGEEQQQPAGQAAAKHSHGQALIQQQQQRLLHVEEEEGHSGAAYNTAAQAGASGVKPLQPQEQQPQYKLEPRQQQLNAPPAIRTLDQTRAHLPTPFPLCGALDCGFELCLILELCDCGSLRDRLSAGGFKCRTTSPSPGGSCAGSGWAELAAGGLPLGQAANGGERGGGGGGGGPVGSGGQEDPGAGKAGREGGAGQGEEAAEEAPAVEYETVDYAAVLDVAMDVARAMSYLHSKNIVHSDLKSRNVLLKSVSGNPATLGRSCAVIAKVSDFGLALRMDHDVTHMSNMYQGTTAFMAPELLLYGRVSKASDVYSFGIVLWELYTCGEAYKGVPKALLAARVIKGLRPDFPHGIPPAYERLAQQCWAAEQANRPTFDQVVRELTCMRAMLHGDRPPAPGPPALSVTAQLRRKSSSHYRHHPGAQPHLKPGQGWAAGPQAPLPHGMGAAAAAANVSSARSAATAQPLLTAAGGAAAVVGLTADDTAAASTDACCRPRTLPMLTGTLPYTGYGEGHPGERISGGGSRPVGGGGGAGANGITSGGVEGSRLQRLIDLDLLVLGGSEGGSAMAGL